MNNVVRDIMSNVPMEDRLIQLAEEASELSQAAIKVARNLGTTNPAKCSFDKSVEDLVEEFNDVLACAEVLELHTDHFAVTNKLYRWYTRMHIKEE